MLFLHVVEFWFTDFEIIKVLINLCQNLLVNHCQDPTNLFFSLSRFCASSRARNAASHAVVVRSNSCDDSRPLERRARSSMTNRSANGTIGKSMPVMLIPCSDLDMRSLKLGISCSVCSVRSRTEYMSFICAPSWTESRS